MKPPKPLHLPWPRALIVLAWAALIALGPTRGAMGADAVPPTEGQKPAAPKTDAPPPAAPTPAPAQFSIRIEMESGGVGKVIVNDGKNPPVVRDLKVQQAPGGAVGGATGGIVIQKVKPEGGPAAAVQLGVAADNLPVPLFFQNIQVHVSKDGAATVQEGDGAGISVIVTTDPVDAGGTPVVTVAPVDVDEELKDLQSPNPRLRAMAARVLAFCEASRIVEPLIEALKDAEPEVRQFAAAGLGRAGDKRAVEPLLALLKDDRREVRSAAAEALGKLGDRWAVEPLLAALKDADWRVRQAAAEALGQIGDRRAILPLDAASDDCQPGVRRAAAAALRAIIGPPPKPLLPDLPEPPAPINSNEAGK
jgi:hypothetical protein